MEVRRRVASVVGYRPLHLSGSGSPTRLLIVDARPTLLTMAPSLRCNLGVILVVDHPAVSLAIVAMVSRLRRSTGEVRQQMKWVLSGAVAVGLGLLVRPDRTESFSRGEQQEWWTSLPLFLGVLSISLSRSPSRSCATGSTTST